MKIPFTKAHGSKNDFLLTWEDHAPREGPAGLARAICDRHTGIGGDGWMLIGKDPEADARIRLFNSDGSEPEMSGNGTRCAAAFLIENGSPADTLRIRTGAGIKHLRLLRRQARRFSFEMNMGRAYYSKEEVRTALNIQGQTFDTTILNVGNPQCAVFVEDFDLDWRAAGRGIETHARFPNRTNVSFVRRAGDHAIEVLFWERGAGETMSSGTGSTGAAFAAVLRGLVKSPIEVRTPAGALELRLDGDEMYLTGPAEIVGVGEFYVG
jgi:diaminopimelate epimerase